MNKIKILFITTNGMWSGSEELWSRAADLFSETGFEISYMARYNHSSSSLEKIKREDYYLRSRSLAERLWSRLGAIDLSDRNVLKKQLVKIKPDAVIISQGNNIDSIEVMEACAHLSIPYFTITQLVSEFHFLFIDDSKLEILREGFRGARRNFFISRHDLLLNNLMLGSELANAEVVYNPCKLRTSTPPAYPDQPDFYSVAMVGRLEFFHKGYDLFLQVVSKQKWRERSLRFNLYGDGPHRQLLQEHIKKRKLTHVVVHGQQEVNEIWKNNQLILMTSRIEGQALSLIEAVWCERAAVVTRVGGAEELITEGVNGFIADVNEESIDAALERAWSVRDQWKALGVAASASLQRNHPADEVKFFCDKIMGQLA